MKKLLAVCIIVILCLCFGSACELDDILGTIEEGADSYSESNTINTPTPLTEGQLRITFIDVGQGDSSFIELPDGKTMLIDASESSAEKTIIDFIKGNGYSKIDYLVATHPHADHIGGMKAVIEAFEIGEIYMPKASTNTKTYEKLLQSISDKGLKIKTAKAGVSICDGIDFIAPNSEEYDELNDYSAVIRMMHGEHKFLFMGDAEVLSEDEILNAGFNVSADVIKVGHHGSGTSSGESFVKAVGAKYAIFSLGEGNSYNHPHTFIVERWEQSGATIYRTDLNGNITVDSDGEKLSVSVEK